jgi:hypothetical protein
MGLDLGADHGQVRALARTIDSLNDDELSSGHPLQFLLVSKPRA